MEVEIEFVAQSEEELSVKVGDLVQILNEEVFPSSTSFIFLYFPIIFLFFFFNKRKLLLLDGHY
jgi:hypothetical protein